MGEISDVYKRFKTLTKARQNLLDGVASLQTELRKAEADVKKLGAGLGDVYASGDPARIQEAEEKLEEVIAKIEHCQNELPRLERERRANSGLITGVTNNLAGKIAAKLNGGTWNPIKKAKYKKIGVKLRAFQELIHG